MTPEILRELIKIANPHNSVEDRVEILKSNLNYVYISSVASLKSLSKLIKTLISLDTKLGELLRLTESKTEDTNIEFLLRSANSLFKAIPRLEKEERKIYHNEKRFFRSDHIRHSKVLSLLTQIKICENILSLIKTENQAKKFFKLFLELRRSADSISITLMSLEEIKVRNQSSIDSRHFESSTCLNLALRVVGLAIKMTQTPTDIFFRRQANLSPLLISQKNKYYVLNEGTFLDEEIFQIRVISTCLLINAHSSRGGNIDIDFFDSHGIINIINQRVIEVFQSSLKNV